MNQIRDGKDIELDKERLLQKFNLNLVSNTEARPDYLHIFLLPLFNKKNDLAIVEYDRFCGYRCAEGRIVFLNKVNAQWIITKSQTTWIGY